MVPIEGREVSVAGREVGVGGSREVSVGGTREDVVVSQRGPEVRGEGIWGREAAEVTKAAEVRGRDLEDRMLYVEVVTSRELGVVSEDAEERSICLLRGELPA